MDAGRVQKTTATAGFFTQASRGFVSLNASIFIN
jgi:hypothetical protein